MEYSASTAPAQGDQGQQGSEGGIFDPYLQSVPEDHREVVGSYLKNAESHVNTQLREAADLRNRFGAYKDIDLSAVPPQQLAQVIDFVTQVGSNPETYQEWLRSEAEATGLLQAQQQQEGAEDQDLEAYIQARIDQALNPVQQRLAQYGEFQSQNERNEAQREMEGHIESTLGRLEAEHRLQLTDEQQEAVLALGDTVQDADWVEQGFAKYQALTGAAQAGFVKDKLGQHAPAMGRGGQAAPDKPRTFADAHEAAMELANQLM